MNKRYNILTRCLTALTLVFVYFVSTSAILVGATTSPALAWRGGGRGYGRGYYGRGYGRGYGYGYGRGYGYRGVYVAPRARGCFYNNWGQYVCY